MAMTTLLVTKLISKFHNQFLHGKLKYTDMMTHSVTNTTGHQYYTKILVPFQHVTSSLFITNKEKQQSICTCV